MVFLNRATADSDEVINCLQVDVNQRFCILRLICYEVDEFI